MFQIEVKTNFKPTGHAVAAAVERTSRDIADRGKQDVAGVGNLGRYGKGFSTEIVKVAGGFVIQGKIRPAFLKVFETGGTSVGRPLLWIPIPPQKTKIHKYRGKLFRPRGTRVLLRVKDKKPLYAGVPSITNRPRFHLRDVAYQEAKKFASHVGAVLRSA